MSLAHAKVLLDFIGQAESGGNYNIVWSGIKQKHRPAWPLVEMTIGEVLAWQDSIDPLYQSEAAGKYQFMEDTLREIVRLAGLSQSDRFDEFGQDRLAFYLLRRRGYDRYVVGKITAESFANKLAREWAGLPLVSGRNKGKSYYDGDGLNSATVSVDDFMGAVRSIGPAGVIVDPGPTVEPRPPKPAPVPRKARSGLFERVARFRKRVRDRLRAMRDKRERMRK